MGFGRTLPDRRDKRVPRTRLPYPSLTTMCPASPSAFEEDSYTVAEGTVTVKVVLSADPERTVTIPLTKTNQGGATAADYSVPSSVVFNDGDTEKTATDDYRERRWREREGGLRNFPPHRRDRGFHGRDDRVNHGRRCASPSALSSLLTQSLSHGEGGPLVLIRNAP